jgi:hypothetical protein
MIQIKNTSKLINTDLKIAIGTEIQITKFAKLNKNLFTKSR